MPKQRVESEQGPRPGGPYSPAIRVGDFIFVSGQVPRDRSGAIVGQTIEEQTVQTLENIKILLEAAGASLDDVVKVTAYLSDLSLFQRYNAVYTTYFNEPQPARTTVGCNLLGFLVEIDVVAYVGADAAALSG